MEELKLKIRETGLAEGKDIIRLDRFLNQQLDIALLNDMSREFARIFGNRGICKVLTVETSGIPIATLTALALGANMVFAKKGAPKNADGDFYISSVYSFTRYDTYKISLNKEFLKKGEKVLIIDDIIANGHSVSGLLDIINRAEAELCGIGVCIDKSYLGGAQRFAKKGIEVKSLAKIIDIKDGETVFDE